MSTLVAPAYSRLRPSSFLTDVLSGLLHTPKTLPCKYLYDERGSRLFDRITELDAYYPTRTETAIMEAHLDEIAACVGPGAVLIEYGSGSSLKTRLLLDALAGTLAAYVPIDISEEHLLRTAERLRADYPALHILPVAADYTQAFTLPALPAHHRRVAYFPGSTIGNFEPEAAVAFLNRVASLVGSGGGLLIGYDLRKAPALLVRAYDDEEGVTAAFNLNLLARINRELRGTFNRRQFTHRAVWNERESRVEMHLVSGRDQRVTVAGLPFFFSSGETIHTESSYKYTPTRFQVLTDAAGFVTVDEWSDEGGRFSIRFVAVR